MKTFVAALVSLVAVVLLTSGPVVLVPLAAVLLVLCATTAALEPRMHSGAVTIRTRCDHDRARRSAR